MRKVLRIDSNGFYIEDVILQDSKAIPSDCIEIICPDGFYKPKWDGNTWVEGLTQAEIDAIKNVPAPKTDTEVMQDTIDTLTSSLSQTSDVLNYMIENY